MPLKSRTTLKSYFETNDEPTKGQYGDLIDSMPNFTDDDPTYGFNWKGDWSELLRYVKYDAVYYPATSSSYVCIKAHDAFVLPTDTVYWNKIVEGLGGGIETPVGTKNGVNKIFTTTFQPTFITINGQVLYQGDGYVLSTPGGLFTITLENAPFADTVLRAHYSSS